MSDEAPFSPSASDVALSDISSGLDVIAPVPVTPINIMVQAGTPLFIPRVNSASKNLNQFSLTNSNNTTNHSFSQLLSNYTEQVASELDVSFDKHLFAHTPGTNYYHSQSLFSVSHKTLLTTFFGFCALHWFNHGVFQSIILNENGYHFNSIQTSLILSASLISVLLFAPIIGYVARFRQPLNLLWIGFSMSLLSAFVSAFADNFGSLFWYCTVHVTFFELVVIS